MRAIALLYTALALLLLADAGLAMTFTPSPDRAGHMRSNWDNWGMIHNGTWHMYYIVGGECPGRWVAYGVATSSDGVHWADQGDMMYASQSGEAQDCANGGYGLGSGWVWQDPTTKKWLVNFSQSKKSAGPGQSSEYICQPPRRPAPLQSPPPPAATPVCHPRGCCTHVLTACWELPCQSSSPRLTHRVSDAIPTTP